MNRTDLLNRGLLLLGALMIIKLVVVIVSANPFTLSYVAEAAATDIIILLFLCVIFYKLKKLTLKEIVVDLMIAVVVFFAIVGIVEMM